MVYVGIYYFVMGLVTFCFYGWDKRMAVKGGWRVPEKTLHLLGLFGGWPGGVMGMRVFKHKRQKDKFVVVFGLTVAVNVGLLVWFYLVLVSD